MTALSARLQNNKLNDLLRRAAEVINGRVRGGPPSPSGTLLRRSNTQEVILEWEVASTYVKCYFERIHPFYPFLDRATFEQTISNPNFSQEMITNKALSALYHAVLALGCQHSGYGSFEPGKSRSWLLFSVALAAFPDLLTLPDSLLLLQALTAMTIFTLSLSCLQIEHIILTESSRRVQKIPLSRQKDAVLKSYARTFWVLYSIEKTSSFYCGRSSFFNDTDIGHCVPTVSEASFGEYNWFLAWSRHARLLSRAYSSLFSIGVTGNSREYFCAVIDQLETELQQWRMSIPEFIRPGAPFWDNYLPGPLTRVVALWTHYLYYGLLLALSRARLHLESRPEEAATPTRQFDSNMAIIKASRSILELSRFIDVEPHTPMWVLVGIPIAALFVLFDFIVHNPNHPETASNLALLHVAGGHFSQIDYASGGALPGSMITEFAFIAAEYTRDVQNRGSKSESSLKQQSTLSSALSWPVLPLNSGPNPAGYSNVPLVGSMVASSQVQDNLDQAFQQLPILQDSANTSSGSMEHLTYPINNHSNYVQDDISMGTNIMDLFGLTVPGVDANLGLWGGLGAEECGE
ncbi:uncharacterized protein Z519_04638 [Cladophialophora bantiana CBS 173.52]|uniref:Xylanolytic transcriptional activator regulatory domain-containing protein n=1 Tax=Cladophialophora bantiana (strain ATCC 10958 / CBS 173.52 / CDC B-1940 / NIH 8579) TaxID=1442370 RepID=A0A0D2EXI7_CLAB1|nr:uncharacterized protein Z519_04638 [Cladophialophora bantiana CBS 173.52]KIW94661.1 hypothetical protein Z519_04638 [Cladophialophora bantiana CBS 173.52]